MNRTRFFALLGLVFFGAALRLMPLGVNVAPIGAIAIFCGLTFKNRWLAVATPLAATFACDLSLGLYNANLGMYLFNTSMLFVYASWVLYALCGFAVRAGYNRIEKLARTPKIFARGGLLAGGSLAGSVLFFIVSNLGFWVTVPTYPRSLAGLMDCYVAAVPFFRATLLSDISCLCGLVAAAAAIRVATSKAASPALVYAD